MAARSGAYRSLPPALALAGALTVPWPLILLTGLSATRIFLVQVHVDAACTTTAALRLRVPRLARYHKPQIHTASQKKGMVIDGATGGCP